MDAIDIAMLDTDGGNRIGRGPSTMFAYPGPLRETLLTLIADPARAERGDLARIANDVTDAHCAAVEAFLDREGVSAATIDIIGFHGQTVFHAPEKRLTRQLFDGACAARRLRIDTASQFRLADVAAGGQGAPLAPLYHQALCADMAGPLMVLNLGGVANVSFIDGDTLTAFDTGPASALIDDFLQRRRGLAFDPDGAIAATGRADRATVTRLMDNPYFHKVPPKSLDRNMFHSALALVDNLSDEDGAATLTAFTVESIAHALHLVPSQPQRWLVCGGGRKNRFLMESLRNRLRTPVKPVETEGWNGDTLEAECFAWLAVRVLDGLPLSIPTTTGVPYPMPGGTIFRKPAAHK